MEIIKFIIEMFVGLLTLGITTFIAYQQLHTNKISLRAEVFDKKMFVFDSTFEMLNNMAAGLPCSDEIRKNFIKGVQIARFIMSKKIVNELEEYLTIIELERHLKDYEGPLPENELTDVIKNRLEITDENEDIEYNLLSIKITSYMLNKFRSIDNLFADEIKIEM
jgi:hypothetical protein